MEKASSLLRLIEGATAAILRRFLADQRGNIAILGALALPLVVGGFAFGAEVGYWRLEQRKLQNAADLSAYAAGLALRGGAPRVEAENTAADIAGASGFDAALGGIILNTPPLSGAFVSDPMGAEILLSRRQARYFTKIFLANPVEINARAVAAVNGGSRACLLALSPTESGAVTVSGSSEVTFTGCDIGSNSSSPEAFLMSGGKVEVTTGCLHTVGGATVTGNLTLSDCSAPNTGAPVSADPYASVQEYGAGGLTCQSGDIGKNNTTTKLTPVQNHSSGAKAMCFSGGLELNGRVELDPGLYIVVGGQFKVNSTTTVVGDSVTILLINGAQADINGGASLDLAAPTSGHYAGIVLFGSRDSTEAVHQINGNAASRLTGAIYAPNSDIAYSGSFGGGGCTQIVVNKIVFTGNSALTVDCQPVGGRDVLVNRTVAIVE